MDTTFLQRPDDARLHPVRPTDQDWLAAKDRIGELYVDQQLTVRSVMNIMKAERGLHATERMYKARLDKWGFAHKNTKGIEYEAMRMIYDNIRASEGIEVKFSAPSGRTRTFYHISRVDKQLVRPGTREKRETNRREIARLGLDQVLQRKGIEVHRPQTDENSTSSPISSSSYVDSDGDHELGTAADSIAVVQNFSESSPASLYHLQLQAQRFDSVIEADLDMSAVFDVLRSMDVSSECYRESWYDISPSILPQQSEAMRDTHVWASHLFETSIKTDEKRTDSAAGDHRNRARRVFKRMLDTNNPHMLSGLIHVSCVISGLGGDDFYRSILRDCWEIIDQNRNGSRNQAYAIPYRYALACEDGNQDAVSQLGRQLLQGTEQNGYDGQTLSTNFLVCQQFRAHHLLEYMQDPEGARDMLQRCLSESSRCLERDHSVNVNCLNILGRAYERLGEYQAAINTYLDAVQRSQVVFGRRHPYRMRILRSIALLQARLGINHEAEQNLQEVFWNRAHLLGPGHGFTFSSQQELQEFLICHGRHGEAIQLTEAREALYHDDKHWKMLSDQEAWKIRREGRNKGLYWEKPQGLFKYEFVMPKEAYMRAGHQI